MRNQVDGMSRLDRLQHELKMKSISLQGALSDLKGDQNNQKKLEPGSD